MGLLTQLLERKAQRDQFTVEGAKAALAQIKSMVQQPNMNPQAVLDALSVGETFVGAILHPGGVKDPKTGKKQSGAERTQQGLGQLQALTGKNYPAPKDSAGSISTLAGKVFHGPFLPQEEMERRKLKEQEQEQKVASQGAVSQQRAMEGVKEEFAAQGRTRREGVGKKLLWQDRDLAEFIESGKLPAVSKPNAMKQVWFKGADGNVKAGFTDEQSRPGEVMDAQTGEWASRDIVAPPNPNAMRGYEFNNLYQAGMGQGLSDAQARRRAGLMVDKKYGLTIGTTEQQMGIRGAESGIGGVPDTSFRLPGAGGSPRPATPNVGGSSGGNVGGSSGGNVGGSSGGAAISEDQQNISVYLDATINGVKPTGAVQIRAIKGRNALLKATGLDPMTLAVGIKADAAAGKQLAETIQREGAIDRLTETIKLHGAALKKNVVHLQQTGSPLLNKPLREAIRLVKGNPALTRFSVDVNAVQREYAYLTAGGAQSRAMLPVNVSEKMETIFRTDATIAEIATAVDEVGKEAQRELAAMGATKQDIVNQIKASAVGQGAGAKPAATIEDGPKPPKPNAPLDANNARKFLDLAGGDKDKARKMATAQGWQVK